MTKSIARTTGSGGPADSVLMPGNGLLYVPPNPCFCYPGAKLTGLLALAPAAEEPLPPARAESRLLRGPAFAEGVELASQEESVGNSWPTYRHDARRTGATTSSVVGTPQVLWKSELAGDLTPPVASPRAVFVSAKDEHTLYALDRSDGRVIWSFTAGGRIDSPPTLLGSLVLFGSADGCVYCLRETDGELVWRLRAAPSERLMVAFGRLESPWRVHGSVLVHDGLVYCTAGRSSFLDGGVRLLAIEPATGAVRHERTVDTRSPTRDDAAGKPFVPSYHMEGIQSDLLVSQGGSIYLGQMKFDAKLTPQETPYVMADPNNPVAAMNIVNTPFTADDPDLRQGFESFRGFHNYLDKAHASLTAEYREKYNGWNLGDRKMGAHLMATAGFLDDTWFNRTFWMYGPNWPGWYHAHRGAQTGQLLVVGPERTFALQAFPTRNRQSPLFKAGEQGYLLLADDQKTTPVLDDHTRPSTKGMGYTRQYPPAWFDWVPIRIRGMVLASSRLYVAGPPDVVDEEDPMAAFEGRKGGVLRVVSAKTGETVSENKLDAPPVFDGMIATHGRLYASCTDGTVICLGGER